MRSFIKFGIGCWTRKIELSKSMKLTKGKMSLKHEQNSNSSLPERQEAYCDLESCCKCHSHASPVAVREKPLQKAALIFILVHLIQSYHVTRDAIYGKSITQASEKPGKLIGMRT